MSCGMTPHRHTTPDRHPEACSRRRRKQAPQQGQRATTCQSLSQASMPSLKIRGVPSTSHRGPSTAGAGSASGSSSRSALSRQASCSSVSPSPPQCAPAARLNLALLGARACVVCDTRGQTAQSPARRLEIPQILTSLSTDRSQQHCTTLWGCARTILESQSFRGVSVTNCQHSRPTRINHQNVPDHAIVL